MVIFLDEIPIYEQRFIYRAINEAAEINYNQECTLISQSHHYKPSSTFVRLNHTENMCFYFILIYYFL